MKDKSRWRAEEVSLGASNEKFVVVNSGVESGMEVSMDPASLLEEVDLPEIKVAEGEQLAGRGNRASEGEQYGAETAPSPSDASPTGDENSEPADEGGSPPGGARSPAAIAAAIFTRSDANGDGKLTEDELPEQFRAGFSEVDSNSDGGIDRAELTAAMSKRMQNRAGGGGPAGAGQ